MILRQKVTHGIAAVAIASLALAGCSQAPEDDGKGGDDKKLDASANEINPKDRSEVGDGGNLRLYNNAFPANWNTLDLDGYEVNANDMMDMVYPSPLQLHRRGRSRSEQELHEAPRRGLRGSSCRRDRTQRWDEMVGWRSDRLQVD